MNPIPVNLAVEDELSQTILLRLLEESGRPYAVGTIYGRGGFGYLKTTIKGWNSAAKGLPFIVVTDLDTEKCPPSLLMSWLTEPKHPNLMFHVAVREIEAWLLADSRNLPGFLGCKARMMPADPEALADPKAFLIDLARKSRFSQIRRRLAPKPGSTATQGPDYNACLGEFVRSGWDIVAASRRSSSLRRAVERVSEFLPSWP
jgi:hypothetical protein